MSFQNFLRFRRRPRPPDLEVPPFERPEDRRDGVPPVANATRLYLVMLLLSRP